LSHEISSLVQFAPKDELLRFRMRELLSNFEEMFQNLDIVFGFTDSHEGQAIVFYERTRNQVIQNFDSIGTGITDTLDFLYMLIVKRGYIFFMDSPEYLLHPHSQRHLYNLLMEYSSSHQIIIATHSPFFFQPDDLFNLRQFNLQDGITRVHRLDLPMNIKDRYRLKRNFSVRNRDAIFADGLIFVEGPSEDFTFPYFFASFGLDLDLNNISLINIGGKASFGVFWKFAHQLKKKFWFFFDNDVLGVKAGVPITPVLFQQSIIFKKRFYFSNEIVQIAENMVEFEQDCIEFQESLELLRILLQQFHVFIFPVDFEGMFEEMLSNRVKFTGGKVAKAMQLVEFIKDHEDEQIIPDRLYTYIKLIKEELLN
jgi:hypothetical protein